MSVLFALLELTTPALLGGLALLALPIAAHLLNRRARRAIVFPSIHLLRASVATQSWLYRLRRWILLCLRCLAVALLVLAFCRPVWLDARTKSVAADKGAAVVLLVDTSASTAQNADGISVLAELRAAGVRALDSLRVGTDLADVVVASAHPHAIFPKLSANVPTLKEELGRVEAGYERADLVQALTVAGHLLAGHDGERRLVVLSDQQRTNWQELAAGKQAATLLPSETQVTLVDVSGPVAENVALAAPRYLPAEPLVGQPMQLVVQVGNFARVKKEVRLSARLDGESLPNQTVTLAPGEQRDVAVESVLKGAGAHEATFEIPADGLAADNRAYLVVSARRQLRVVVLGDDDPNEAGTASYFLTRALSPHNDPRNDRFELRHVSSAQLTDASLADASAVFVGYLAELNPSAAATLLRFMQGGGGVLFFCGEGAVSQNLRQLEQAAGKEGVLPWEPGTSRTKAAPVRALTITNGMWRARLLREFDEQSQLAIAQIRFARVWSIGTVSPESTVLLSFSDGTPALGSRPVGRGQFLLANFSPALEASDLGKYGSFVALVQTLAQQLGTVAAREPRAVVGEPYRFPHPFRKPPGAARLTAIGPRNESVPIATSANAELVDVELQQTPLPGIYHLRSGDQTVAAAALNVDPRESNLERMDRDALLRDFNQSGMAPTRQTAGDWEPLANLRGRALWGWCLASTLAVFGIELFFLGYWKK